MSIYNHDFDEFFALMKQTTENLKKMNTMQTEMRWQFGHMGPQYKVVVASSSTSLELLINKWASEDYRPILISPANGSSVYVIMELK